MVFCTLFDSYYLDKGIALYDSIDETTKDFTLFAFCFDDNCYEILKDINYEHMVAIHHSCIENEELIRIKEERSKAEYCWTCTPIIIEYVLDNYPVEECTYIDSDLFFYSDPIVLFDEIKHNNADVCIIEHRFNNDIQGKKFEERNGRFCVEFNYFKNNKKGRFALNWWKEKCLEWCYDIPEKDRMGDQKYLNDFPRLFDSIHILENLGAGVAPWNLKQYKLVSKENGIVLEKDGEKVTLVFYHFQNIRYMPGNMVNIKSLTSDKNIKYAIYIPYIRKIETIRKKITERYGIDFKSNKIVRSSNKLLGFLQKYFASFKIRRISDIIDLNKLDKYE